MKSYERAMKATHAYVGIYDGMCKAVTVDMSDKGTADFVSEVISEGGMIERVTIEIARKALFEPWPLTTDV